jgi:predicted  nucleic acid-binding Zn-ribbon protein
MVLMVFEKETVNIQSFNNEVVKIINTNTRRIRSLEQRLDGLEMRIGAIEEKIINEMDALRKNFDEIGMDIKDISKNLNELRNEILKINKTIDKTAKKAEVKELESLLDLYNPIRSKFTTREEVERLVDEKLGQKT